MKTKLKHALGINLNIINILMYSYKRIICHFQIIVNKFIGIMQVPNIYLKLV